MKIAVKHWKGFSLGDDVNLVKVSGLSLTFITKIEVDLETLEDVIYLQGGCTTSTTDPDNKGILGKDLQGNYYQESVIETLSFLYKEIKTLKEGLLKWDTGELSDLDTAQTKSFTRGQLLGLATAFEKLKTKVTL